MTDGPTPNPPQDQPSWPTPQAPAPSPGWSPPQPQPSVPPAWSAQPTQPGQPAPGWNQPPAPPAQPGWNPQPASPAQPGWTPPAQAGWQPGGPALPPPPGGFVPGEQGPKKRRKWPWILLAIFLLMALGIGACSAFVFKAISGPTTFGNEFADKLYSNPATAAQDLCPGATVDAAGLQRTHDALVANGWTGSKRLLGSNVTTANGSTSAIVGGTLGSSTVSIEMAKVNGDWCITNFIDSSLSTISIPDISIPDLSIPDLSLPDLTVPEMEITPAS